MADKPKSKNMGNKDNEPNPLERITKDEDEKEILEEIQSMVSEEPRTVNEVHESVGKPRGKSRDQIEYRMNQMANAGSFSSKKSPGRTAPQIYWDDNEEE